MERDAPQGDRTRSLLLALIAAAVLAAGVAVVWTRGSVDQASVLEATDPQPSSGTGQPSPDAADTVTTSPQAEDPAAERSGAAADGGDGAVDGAPDASGSGEDGDSGNGGGGGADGSAVAGESPATGAGGSAAAPVTGDAAPAGGAGPVPAGDTLPYGTPADQRTAAQAPAELAQTGPAAPVVLAAVTALAGLLLGGLGRVAGPRRRRTRVGR